MPVSGISPYAQDLLYHPYRPVLESAKYRCGMVGDMKDDHQSASVPSFGVSDTDRVKWMHDAPFARLLGIEIESVEADRAVCSLELRPEHLNSMGRAHGAVVYALMDQTFGVLANLVHDATGQSSSLSYYRPAFGRLTAVAEPVNRSGSFETYTVKVLSEEGKLIASGTFMAFVLRKH